jgi:hypothetical protein
VACAIKCLRGCLGIIRLCRSHLATTSKHSTCDSASCGHWHLKQLVLSVHQFFNEFSCIILSKADIRSKQQWWLAYFYGLWIMGFTHRALVYIQCQMDASRSSASDPLNCAGCAPQFRLALHLFKALSGGKDPLAQEWSLETPPQDSHVDLRLLKYYRMGRRTIMLWNPGRFQASGSFGLLKEFLVERGGSVNLADLMALDKIGEPIRDSDVAGHKLLPLGPSVTTAWEPEQFGETRQLSECRAAGYPTRRTKSANYRKRPAGSPPSEPSLSPLPLPISNSPWWSESPTADTAKQDPIRSRPRGRRDSIYSSMSHYSRDSSRLSKASCESLVGLFGKSGSPASLGALSPVDFQPTVIHNHGPTPRTGSNDSLSSLRRTVGGWSIVGHSSSSRSSPAPPMPSPKPRGRPSSRRFSFTLGGEHSPIRESHMCECCPKQPKKFDTVEQLRCAHNVNITYVP